MVNAGSVSAAHRRAEILGESVGCHALPSALRFPYTIGQIPPVLASSEYGRKTRTTDSRSVILPNSVTHSHRDRDHGRPEQLRHPVPSTSLTASSLNSPLIFLLCIPTLWFCQTPYLGSHEIGSRPEMLSYASVLTQGASASSRRTFGRISIFVAKGACASAMLKPTSSMESGRIAKSSACEIP